MTGVELVEYLQRLYGGRWVDEVGRFGGLNATENYLDSFLNERVNRFSYRIRSISKMFPVFGDQVPRVNQVGLIVLGRFREAAGVPNLVGMIDMLRNYRGVVLPLDHPAFYWFKSSVVRECGAEYFEDLRVAHCSSQFIQRLKPIYRQVMKQVESGFCHDYPCFVHRELTRLDECRKRAVWFRSSMTDADIAVGQESLKRLKVAIKGDDSLNNLKKQMITGVC